MESANCQVELMYLERNINLIQIYASSLKRGEQQ